MRRITLTLNDPELDALDAAKNLLRHNGLRDLTDALTVRLILLGTKPTQAQLVDALDQIRRQRLARRADHA